MDFVPFTLFFMVCLLNFRASLSRPQHSEEAIKWPKTCAGKTFCTDNSTYPSLESIKAALDSLEKDLSKVMLPTIDNRSSLDHTCQSKVTMDPVYLIRDDNDRPWFVVQVPQVFEFKIRIEECTYYETPFGFDDTVKCGQVRTSTAFIVLSHDLTRVQTVRVKDGLPTSCSPKVIDLYN